MTNASNSGSTKTFLSRNVGKLLLIISKEETKYMIKQNKKIKNYIYI